MITIGNGVVDAWDQILRHGRSWAYRVCVLAPEMVVGTTSRACCSFGDDEPSEEKETCKGKCRKFIYSGSDEGGFSPVPLEVGTTSRLSRRRPLSEGQMTSSKLNN